jgi:hypothetical protein
MNALYVLIGFACLTIGIWITYRQVRIFSKGQQDQLGFSIQLLAGGITAIILGLGLIIQYH